MGSPEEGAEMSDLGTDGATAQRTPWHVWVVGIVAVLWNVSGAYTIVSAQSGATMDMDAREIAYYAAQAQWFKVVTDVALFAAIGAAFALLLRSKFAVRLYGLSLAAIVFTSVYDIAQGTALLLQGRDWLILACVTTGLAVLQLLYAIWLRKRGVLR
jgi:hypothetical protein